MEPPSPTSKKREERQAKAAATKADLENQLAEAQQELKSEEAARQDMAGTKKRMEEEVMHIMA